MITGLEAKQLAIAARAIRERDSVLHERADSAIRSAADANTLGSWFGVDTEGASPESIDRVLRVYRSNGWDVSYNATDSVWMMKVSD